MALLGVADVAAKIGVSRRRVRQMLASGAIAGQRVGNTWVINPKALDVLRQRRLGSGRPWKPESAWALLAVASGRDVALSPSQRSRTRHRLEAGLDSHLAQLTARCAIRSCYAHPSTLPILAAEPDIVTSGVSAAARYRLDIVAVYQFEGYIPESALPALIEKFALEEGAARPNATLRVVADQLWPFGPDEDVAPPAVVAVDLLESGDARTRRAGAQLLRELRPAGR
ncbi:MAG: helix-turn-helix domain-containing protein [bacterium]|nr:helix-turn-helix domain-containing protein [bacterium]MDE0234537.1 helix-turn-helix domain-containing protein [bacterium]